MKKIPGYLLYFAGEDGRIYKQKGKYKRQLTQFVVPYGKYLNVYLTIGRNEKKLLPVHKLVASAYNQIYYSRINVEHIDGNIFNNIPENLRIHEKKDEDGQEDDIKKNAIRFYEDILMKKIKFDYSNSLWQKYNEIKDSGDSRKIYNWLYVNLR
jgi:hypothetical protein